MKLGLEGKVVIVTGGSKGIGLACARAFLVEGGRVAIVSRSQANLDAALRDLAAPADDLIAVSCDLSGKICGERDGGRSRAASWPGGCAGKLGRRSEALFAGGAERRSLARSYGRQVLHLHPRHGRRAACDGEARQGSRRQHHRHGRKSGHADPSARGRRELRADAGNRGPRERIRAEGRSHQRHQPRRHDD